jgi:hypothetical protein
MIGSRPIRVEVPHEPGEEFEFRRPSWIQEQDAREGAEKKNRKQAADFGAAFIKELNQVDPDETEEQAEERVDLAHKRLKKFEYDLSQFDLGILLEAGITGWSYVRDGVPIPLNAEELAELDGPTAKWAGQEIVDLLKPDTEEEEKNS